MTKLVISKLKPLNTIVIKKQGQGFFLTTDNSIIIPVDSLAFILKFLVQNDFISRKILEGILEEVSDVS